MSSPVPGDYTRDLTAHDANPADADGLIIDVSAQSKDRATRRMPWSRLGSWVTGIVERVVPSWARAATPPQIHTSGGDLPTLPEDGHDYTLQGRDPPGASPPIRFWRRPNFVPNTPGTASGVGRLLTVIGEDDTDYGWRDPVGGAAGATPQRGDTLPLNPAEGREFFLDRDWHQPSTQHILDFQPQAYSGRDRRVADHRDRRHLRCGGDHAAAGVVELDRGGGRLSAGRARPHGHLPG